MNLKEIIESEARWLDGKLPFAFFPTDTLENNLTRLVRTALEHAEKAGPEEADEARGWQALADDNNGLKASCCPGDDAATGSNEAIKEKNSAIRSLIEGL